MKHYLILICLIFNCATHAATLKPCQAVGYERVGERTIPLHISGFSPKAREEALIILKKCISENAVCIVGDNPQSAQWLSTELIEPQNGDFDPMKTDLIFALIQYVDTKTGLSYCITARYDFTDTIEWNAKKWIIDGKHIKENRLYDKSLGRVKTPKSLYKVLLKAEII